MAAAYLRFLAICVIAGYVWTARDEKVCSIRTQSCGLIPPPLPRNFEYKGELADFTKKSFSFQEVYFDNVNLRGKVVITKDNTEFNYIFDYDVSQVIQYARLNPGKSMKRDPLSEVCSAVPMESSPLRFIFGYRDAPYDTKNARMYNSYQALRYGDEYQYSANKQSNLVNRGLKTNDFISCVYDPGFDATLLTEYLFTDNETIPAAPDASSDSLTIPVQVTMNGTINYNHGDPKSKMKYDTQLSFAWFKKNPKFETTTFKIPQWLYCKNYKGSKDFPELPTAFSVDLEVTSFTQDMDGKIIADEILLFYKIWYNAQQGVARRDFTPLRERDSDIYSKFQNLGTVTSIYDFNSGVLYNINKASGRCFARAIERDEFFVTTKDKMHVRMAGPEEIFYMERDTMEYKGKDFMRDIFCDVWAGKYYDKDMNVTSYIETGISTDGWHDSSSAFSIPVRHTVITSNTDTNGIFRQTVVENNFFRFKSSPPRSLLFDLHNTACIDTIDRKYLGITLSITQKDLDVIKSVRVFFLETIQYYMVDITLVGTPMRIQALKIEKIDGKDMITFALLEKTKLKTNVPATVLGVNLEEAITNLQTYIDSGRFLVKFTNPQTNQDMGVLALPNGLVMFKSPIETFADPQEAEATPIETFVNKQEAETEFFIETKEMKEERINSWADDNKIVPTKITTIKGMSAGGLAGLSIGMLIIGIGVGIAIMYLYIRKFGSQGLEDSYAMQSKR